MSQLRWLMWMQNRNKWMEARPCSHDSLAKTLWWCSTTSPGGSGPVTYNDCIIGLFGSWLVCTAANRKFWFCFHLGNLFETRAYATPRKQDLCSRLESFTFINTNTTHTKYFSAQSMPTHHCRKTEELPSFNPQVWSSRSLIPPHTGTTYCMKWREGWEMRPEKRE